eukprot:gb/GECG01015590.1/.p1 GENE.gb/GECG01015590.1/~~gb/GECG01015590.1/.p1  ORF type:complete len:350 (+),score=34.74 gb/GECG01015590.1/:1-1050(+)
MDIFSSPIVSSMAFHPRRAKKNETTVAHAVDGEFKLPEGDANTRSSVMLGYRIYPYPYGSGSGGANSRPLVLYFHGNAEVCSDYDGLHKYFHDKLGVSLMVVDYRGYGWGTSEPTLMTLQPDARHILSQLDAKLEQAGIGEVPIILFGRSIGSVCAIHLARLGQKIHSGETDAVSESQSSAARRIRAIVLESPICSLLELPLVKQLGSMIPSLTSMLESGAISDPWNNSGQIQRVHLPLLVIHGEKDEISPVQQGLRLFNEAGTAKERKSKLVFSSAGHNDLTSTSERLNEYFDALYRFISTASSDDSDHPAIESGAGKSPRGEGHGRNSGEGGAVSGQETEQCGCNVS